MCRTIQEKQKFNVSSHVSHSFTVFFLQNVFKNRSNEINNNRTDDCGAVLCDLLKDVVMVFKVVDWNLACCGVLWFSSRFFGIDFDRDQFLSKINKFSIKFYAFKLMTIQISSTIAKFVQQKSL